MIYCLENRDKHFCLYIHDMMKKQIYTQTNESFVEWLKIERKKKNLTLRQVAEKIGRHHSIIGNIENQNRRMDVAEFYEYCKLLGLDPCECFEYIKAREDSKHSLL